MKSSNPTKSSTPEFESGTADASRSTPGSVKEIAGDAKRAAGSAFNQAKERAATMAQEQKQSAAEHIGRYGTALRDSARSVEGEDPNVAYYANRAAESIERMANYVRATDLTGLRRDAEDIARRHPALFMGGMFIAGIVLGGLVKTSAKTLREDSASSDYPSEEPFIDPFESPGTMEDRAANNI